MKSLLRILGVTVIACIAISALLWWTHTSDEQQRRNAELSRERAERNSRISLKSSINLPNGDGTVYVIESPADQFGLDIHTCMVHVKQTASSMACTPAKMNMASITEN